MKSVILVALAGFLFAGCGRQETNYTIEGEWEDGDGEVVYLKKDLGNEKFEQIDSAVVKNGMFRMQKPLRGVDEGILQAGLLSQVIILDSVPIHVKCKTLKKNEKGRWVKIEIDGSIEQDLFKSMMDAQRNEMLVMMNIAFMGKDGELSKEKKDSVGMLYVNSKRKTDQIMDSLVSNHPDNYVSALIINNIMTKRYELKEIEQMYARLTPRVRNSYLGKKLKVAIEKLELSAVGSLAPDFTLKDKEGKEVHRSDFCGKYLLLDFWASWCGPCLREIPNLKELYKKYHGQGFEILSVSLDDNQNDWLQAVEQHKLDWRHVSSLKGWKCPIAKLYNVTGIPAMFLLNKEGKIVATGLRGGELQKQVASFFE